MKNLSKNFKRGGVSMFMVVIAGSVVALMVASFTRLVLRDGSQASNQDLSQSAYDSAQVGVEDAKRLVTNFATKCANGLDVTTNECQRIQNALTSNACDSTAAGLNIARKDGETQIQSSAGDNQLNQAYTCVKVKTDTPDFVGTLAVGASKIVPLRSAQTFRKVRLSWHSKQDLSSPTNTTVNLENIPINTNPQLVANERWNADRPAVIKAQFYGYTAGIRDLDTLNQNFSSTGNGLDEQIYYPTSNALNVDQSLPSNRRTGDNQSTDRTTPVRCEQNLNSKVYACSVVVNLGHDVNPADTALLRLTPIYRAADFKLELLDSSNRVIDFRNVQPEVDSTGRANDKFRRVISRIEFVEQNFPVPDFAVQLQDENKALCKELWVTNAQNGDLDCTVSP